MRLAEMPAKKAKKIMFELIPYVSHLHSDAVTIETKQCLDQDSFTFLQFMEKASSIAMKEELQDKIVSLLTDKSITEVQELTYGEYMDALSEFAMRDLIDFFGWWLVTIKQV